MQRLTGVDAGFLYMETPSSAMHVAGLAIVDPTDMAEQWRGLDRITELIESRLHLAPPFRRRLVTVPLQLHHPVWIEDPDFDLRWHVRRIAVPPPGGARELADLAAHLNSIQLDRSRPLWELWVIEGLEDGNVALLSKVHHSAIDGASGNQLTVSLYDLSPEVAEVPPPDEPWQPDRVPTDVELIGYALNSLSRTPVRAVKAIRRTTSMALNLRRTNRQPDVSPPPAPFSAPRTSINQALTPHRSYAMTTLSLDDVKRVKNAFGTTVNDVVLALCSGALRRYFDDHGEQLEGPLVAMVPVSVRSESDKAAMGNQVSSVLASLATDLDDPVARLAAIHEGMSSAKEQHNVIGADTLTDWAEFAPPAVFSLATRLYSRTKLADRHRPFFNVTISNVPGPPFPLYSAGARLVANYPMGPIFDGAGINMTVMSYQDNLDFGLLACPDVVDDVWSIADALGESLEALLKAAASQEGSSTEPAPAPVAAGESAPPAPMEPVIPAEAMGATDHMASGTMTTASRTATSTTPKKITAKRVTGRRTAPRRVATSGASAKKTTAKKTTAKKTAPKQLNGAPAGAKRTASRRVTAKRRAS